MFAVVLLAAAAITFLACLLQRPREVGTAQLAVAILGVVALNAVIGFAQEYSAERTVQALQAMVPRTCRVLREGERREAPVADLVPGDVVVLEADDAVPADCRLVEAQGMRLDNAARTPAEDPEAAATECPRGSWRRAGRGRCRYRGQGGGEQAAPAPDRSRWQVTVVDQDERHVYQAGLRVHAVRRLPAR
jgi:hypothetical protein